MASLSDGGDRGKAIAILDLVRERIAEVAGQYRELMFQVRRYEMKRLEFDERGTPTQRRKLKEEKKKVAEGAMRGV